MFGNLLGRMCFPPHKNYAFDRQMSKLEREETSKDYYAFLLLRMNMRIEWKMKWYCLLYLCESKSSIIVENTINPNQ